MNRVELLAGPVPVVLLTLGVAAALWLFLGRGRPPLAVVASSITVAGVLTAAARLLTERLWNTWGAPLDRVIYAWAWAALAALTLAGWGTVRAAVKSPQTSRRAAGLAALTGALAFLAAAELINLHFGEYATVGSLFDNPGVTIETLPEQPSEHPPSPRPRSPATETDWAPPPDLPIEGKVLSARIPSTTGMPTSDAYVYLPPAYLTANRPDLPVLVLLHGVPGRSLDWIDGGRLSYMMDAYAAAHKGLAPVVVMPDVGANFAPNPPLCLDTKYGQSSTYLAVDVPNWVKNTLGAGLSGKRQWAVAGFSYGGTCALQLAVNHPETYPTFIDISGEDAPTINAGREALIRLYFDGDRAAFARQNALDVLRTRAFPDTAGIITIGEADAFYGPQGRTVAAAARDAGMDVRLKVVPGSHNWQAWRGGLESNLDWLTHRLGLH